MGGKNERMIDGIRVHESGGEVHFHDDTEGIRVAVPVADAYAAWQKLSDGLDTEFTYTDRTNELCIAVVEQSGTVDLTIAITRHAPIKKANYQAFESLMNGTQAPKTGW